VPGCITESHVGSLVAVNGGKAVLAQSPLAVKRDNFSKLGVLTGCGTNRGENGKSNDWIDEREK
jgi:hypothetical protein